MYLIYFDEVKDDDTTQDFFWVGGIAVEVGFINSLEESVSAISEEYFGTPCLGAGTEFHAAEIFHRKKLYKEWRDPTVRIALISKLLRTIDTDEVKKIYVKIYRNYFNQKFSTKQIDEMAFMMFCEKADALMCQLQDIGMLIGDRESTSIASRYAECLSNWRAYQTDYHLGRELTNLIDTVHFTESHLSRLLQLADIHIWCRQFRSLNRDSDSDINLMMLKEINESGDAMFANKYKEYPHGC